MKNNTVLIVGGGIAGLTAAWILSEAGLKVTVLEARKRTGGRIFTYSDQTFCEELELGAEFIHGNMPYTFRLLKKFGIDHHRIKGGIFHSENGKLVKDKELVDQHHELLEKKLNDLEDDATVRDFLEKNFAHTKYSSLYKSVKDFVEGYDTADIGRASVFNFRKEWLEAERWEIYRVKEGYGALVEALHKACAAQGCFIYTGKPVSELRWKRGIVEAVCADKKVYSAAMGLVTVPLGVLQREELSFVPALNSHTEAAKQIGYGSVIKLCLQFTDSFWRSEETKRMTESALEDLLFLFSDEEIPTWWTENAGINGLLCGWLGGPASEELSGKTEEQIIEIALRSLSSIFKTELSLLREKLSAWKVADWNSDPWSRGSYSYATLNADRHIRQLASPVENTLFFAGEALGTNSGVGLVESAIESAHEVSEKMLIASSVSRKESEKISE